MNKDRQLMNAAIKELVIPELRERGFKGAFPHFRRIASDFIHLLTFQFDRYGGGFVIEIAKAPNEPFVTGWGKVIEQKKLRAHDLSERVRIHPKGRLENSSTDDWFRYDKKLFFQKNIYLIVAKQVLKNLFIADEYWDEEDSGSEEIDKLNEYQRIYAITKDSSVAEALINEGFESAAQIVSMSKGLFLSRYGKIFSSIKEAKKVYSRAAKITDKINKV